VHDDAVATSHCKLAEELRDELVSNAFELRKEEKIRKR